MTDNDDTIMWQCIQATIANQECFISSLVAEHKLTDALHQISVLEGMLIIRDIVDKEL